jgi:hypothetical protein
MIIHGPLWYSTEIIVYSIHYCNDNMIHIRLVNLNRDISFLAGTFDGQKIGSFFFEVNF